MVGMHTSGFDRLVEALDRYAGRHPELEVVVQSGHGRYRPGHARAFAFKDGLAEDIGRADVVVSQGSVGFFDALRLGKRLVVVPRQARFGEAIDDHQVDFARGMARRHGFPVVLDIAGLEEALDAVRSAPPPAPVPLGAPTGLHRDLRAFLASCSTATGSPPPRR